MTRILGIDPGLSTTGWGIIEAHNGHLRYVACGSVTSSTKDPLAVRLERLYDGIKSVITLYQPTHCAIEETFINTNAQSSLKLGHARGCLMLAAAHAGLPVAEYAARLVKKSVVGVGNAEKQQIMVMVKHLLPHAELTSADAADALAVAITHVGHEFSSH